MAAASAVTLPPGVKGRGRGELIVAVGNFVWQGAGKKPLTVSVLVRWWGQSTPGLVIQLPASDATESCSFPVVVAPRHLIRYLRDMGTLALSVDHYRGGNLGIVNVPVGWLDVRSPVVGSFPVIAVGGQRVGSLDVTLELHYTSDSLASFELQERLAAAQDASQDAAGRSSDYTLNQDAGLHEPEQHQEVVPGIEFEEVLDQLDLFEVLHSKLYRDFDAFHGVYKIWEGGGRGQRTIGGLLRLLQNHRIFRYPISQEQLVYLEVVLDPAGDLPLSLDELLLGIRQSQEAGLRVRAAQLSDVAPLLTPLVAGLEQRGLLLRQAMRASRLNGTPGVMSVKQMASWVQQHIPGIVRQQLRYLAALLLHMSEGPIGTATYQDVINFVRIVREWGGAPRGSGLVLKDGPATPGARSQALQGLTGQQRPDTSYHDTTAVRDVSEYPTSVDDAPGTPAPPAKTAAAEPDSVETTPASALQRLKQRVSRPARLGGQVHRQAGSATGAGAPGNAVVGGGVHHMRSVSQPGVSSQAQVGALAAGHGITGTTAAPVLGTVLPAPAAGGMSRAASDPVQVATVQSGLPSAAAPTAAGYAGPVLPSTRPNMPRFTQLDAHGRAGVLAVLGGAPGAPVQVQATDQGLAKGLAVGQPTGVRPSADGQLAQEDQPGAGLQGAGTTTAGSDQSGADGGTAAAAAAIMARADELRRQLDAALYRDGGGGSGTDAYGVGARGSPSRGLLGRLSGTALPFLTEPSVMADLMAGGSPGSAPASLAGSPTRYRAGASPPPFLHTVRANNPASATVSLDAQVHPLGNPIGVVAGPARQQGVLPAWGEYHQAAYTDDYYTQDGGTAEEGVDIDGVPADQGFRHPLVSRRRGGQQLSSGVGQVQGGHYGRDDGGDDEEEEEDAEEFAEQVLLKQLFFAGVHPHGAAAALDAAVAAGNTSQGSSLQSSPGVTRGTASRPGTARNLRNSAGSEGLDAGGGGGDGDGLRGDALHTVMEEESGHLSEAEDEESHPPGAALVVTLRNLQLTLAPGSHVGIRARASCSKRQLCRVLQYTGNNNSNTPGTSAGVGATGAGPGAAHQQLGGAVTAASSTTTTAAPLFRCALPAALPAMPLTAAAATLILELWSVPGPPSSPPLRQPFPQQAVAGAEVQGDTTPQPSLVWALDPDVLDESQGCDLLGVAVVPLTLPVGSARATADGVFPIKDVLGSSGSAGDPVLGTVDVLASLERAVPLVRHTWRVTVCGAAGLPSAEEMEAAGLPAPSGRYARYYYPGEANALFTEDVPPSDAPIFAATATHCILLPAGKEPTPELLGAVGAQQGTQAAGNDAQQGVVGQLQGQQEGSVSQPEARLVFEVWDRWDAGPDTCVGRADLPLAHLLSLEAGPPSALALPLQLAPDACERPLLLPPTTSASTATEAGYDKEGVVGGVPGTQASSGGPIEVVGGATEPGKGLAAGAQMPVIEVRLQAHREPVGPSDEQWVPAAASPGQQEGAQGQGHHAGDVQEQGAGGTVVQGQHGSAATAAAGRPVTARIRVDVARACGLQAAVQEAQAWLGGGSAVLGRAHQLGPHPYVTVNLFPSDERLARRLPPLRTPFQAQTFCPDYSWSAEADLSLDPPILAALATGHLCTEVWHHPSRSLAAMLASQQPQASKAGTGSNAGGPTGGASGVEAAAGRGATAQGGVSRDVLLGSGTYPLSKLLTRPQGIQAWVVVKSPRGEPVGAVQLSAAITHLNGVPVDMCSAAPPPLLQAHGLAASLPAGLPPLLPAPGSNAGGSGTAVSPSSPTASSAGGPALTSSQTIQGSGQSTSPHGASTSAAGATSAPGFHGQWVRCTLYLEHITLPAGGTTPTQGRLNRSHKFYATYTLPGSSVEVNTAAKPALPQDEDMTGSRPGGGAASRPRLTTTVALGHVGIHWVQATPRLVGSLMRSPLRLTAWRAHERSQPMGGSRPGATTAAAGPQWLSTQLVGTTDVDLSSLALPPALNKPLQAARWVSGSYLLVDPGARFFAGARVRVKVLLELSPPSHPPPAILAASAWQPSDEYDTTGDHRRRSPTASPPGQSSQPSPGGGHGERHAGGGGSPGPGYGSGHRGGDGEDEQGEGDDGGDGHQGRSPSRSPRAAEGAGDDELFSITRPVQSPNTSPSAQGPITLGGGVQVSSPAAGPSPVHHPSSSAWPPSPQLLQERGLIASPRDDEGTAPGASETAPPSTTHRGSGNAATIIITDAPPLYPPPSAASQQQQRAGSSARHSLASALDMAGGGADADGWRDQGSGVNQAGTEQYTSRVSLDIGATAAAASPSLSTGGQDPGLLLQLQLQELDALSLQWRNRLGGGSSGVPAAGAGEAAGTGNSQPGAARVGAGSGPPTPVTKAGAAMTGAAAAAVRGVILPASAPAVNVAPQGTSDAGAGAWSGSFMDDYMFGITGHRSSAVVDATHPAMAVANTQQNVVQATTGGLLQAPQVTSQQLPESLGTSTSVSALTHANVATMAAASASSPVQQPHHGYQRPPPVFSPGYQQPRQPEDPTPTSPAPASAPAPPEPAVQTDPTGGGLHILRIGAGTAPATQHDAARLAAAVETCSDAGGDGFVLGGVTESEADTDELLASIPVAYERVTHESHTMGHSSHVGHSSPQQQPLAGPATSSQPTSQQAQGAVSQAAAAASQARSGQAPATSRSSAMESPELDWMFSVSRSHMPHVGGAGARGSPASRLPVPQHPATSPVHPAQSPVHPAQSPTQSVHLPVQGGTSAAALGTTRALGGSDADAPVHPVLGAVSPQGTGPRNHQQQQQQQPGRARFSQTAVAVESAGPQGLRDVVEDVGQTSGSGQGQSSAAVQSLQDRLDRLLYSFQAQLTSANWSNQNPASAAGPNTAGVPGEAGVGRDGSYVVGGMHEEAEVQRVELDALTGSPGGVSGPRFANVLPPPPQDFKLEYSDGR